MRWDYTYYELIPQWFGENNGVTADLLEIHNQQTWDLHMIVVYILDCV